MGIFDRIFGKKEKAGQSKTKSGNRQNFFITNSNNFGLGDIELGISGKVRVDGLMAIAAMEKIAKNKNKEFKFSVMYTTLLEEGALTIPVVCSIGKERYSLYFIYHEEELLKYKDLIKHISRTSYPNLIYFSSIPIYDGYIPKPIIEPFQLADLRYNKESKVAGVFAMWWSTDTDPLFHKSKTFEYLTKLNEFIKGYETYMAGYVLRQTRIIREIELKRMTLPENHATYIIDAPEEKKVILDISKEKGIRFLFNISETTVEYRDRFIKGAVVDLVANIMPLKQNNFPIDDRTEPNSYDWFNFMTRNVKQKEENGELKEHQIGIVEFNVELN